VVFTDNGPQSLEDLLKSHPDTKDVFMEEGQDDELMLRDEFVRTINIATPVKKKML